eukprot:635101-Prorocentrum_minimum.AAC.1
MHTTRQTQTVLGILAEKRNLRPRPAGGPVRRQRVPVEHAPGRGGERRAGRAILRGVDERLGRGDQVGRLHEREERQNRLELGDIGHSDAPRVHP